MLDVKYVIDNLEEVIERLSTRTGDYSYLRQLISQGYITQFYEAGIINA